MKRIVFISHSSADRPIAERVCAYLEEHGVACWMAPRDVTPGKNYGAAIVDAIDECKVFVLILSNQSNKSRQVVREVERAASADSVILPFRIEDVQPSRDIAFYVSAAHWLDATKHPVDEQFDELLNAIQDWQQAGAGTDHTSAPASVGQTPPPLPAQPPATPPSISPPARRRGFPILPAAAIATVVVLVLGGLLLYRGLYQQPAKPAIALQVPTPTATPLLATPEPTASPVQLPVNEASPSATETSPHPSPPLTTPPIRLKPGERLRPTTTPEPTAVAAATPSPVAPPLVSSSPAPAFKGPVVREIAASSQLNEEHRPSLAFDGNPATAWMPKGRAIGQSLFVNFKAPSLIRSVSILNGDSRDEDHYRESNRIRSLRIVLSEGTNQLLTFRDEMKTQRFELQKPVTATWAKFEIVSVFPGSKTKHVEIPEITFNEP